MDHFRNPSFRRIALTLTLPALLMLSEGPSRGLANLVDYFSQLPGDLKGLLGASKLIEGPVTQSRLYDSLAMTYLSAHRLGC